MNARTHGIVQQLKNALEAMYGARLRRVVVFGSQARGDAELSSDIDLLVVLKGPVQPGAEIARTGEIVAELSLQAGAVISCLFMDEDRYLHRAGPLLRNIRREGVPA
jgi:predicted nucleotidyltransferase